MADDSGWCNGKLEDTFFKYISGQLWLVEVMLLVNAILAGVIVGIGAYGLRYRHYGFTRYLLLGATTLFLPIISYVLSAKGSTGDDFDVVFHDYIDGESTELIAKCFGDDLHTYVVMVSTCLVLISAINTSPTVATDDGEDQSIRPPFELLVQGIWIIFLVISNHAYFVKDALGALRFTPFAIIYAKMALKCYAFLAARKSFALGRNPRLIVGYMQQLREGSDQNYESREEDVTIPPPLVVMGEDELQVEKQPHGYIFINLDQSIQGGGLVTIDRVWELENMFPRDICLSFALFKLLRCRFSRHRLTHVISTDIINFVRSVLLKDGVRAFTMIADELSFLHDYCDSPLPISYSASWLIIISMVISLLTIVYCILCGMDIITTVYKAVTRKNSGDWNFGTMYTVTCTYYCRLPSFVISGSTDKSFGNMYFELVPVLLLLVFVVTAEARDVASHISSSWTKVILTCRCVHRASLKLSPVVPKWVGFLLRCRCDGLMRHWSDKMRQRTLLMLHPRQFHQLVLPGFLSRLLDRKKNNVKVPLVVKACIINALRSASGSNGASLSKGITSLRQSQVGGSLVWACNNSKGTSDTILVWHIAMTILEVRHPHHQQDGRPSTVSVSEKRTSATHLSRYCVYLVESCPELLPDDDTWSKDLYNKVKKDAKRALAAGGGIRVSSMPPEVGYRRLIELLGATGNHGVLKDAAKLAEELGKLSGCEEMVWELMAGFWSEMILYLAPSENIKGHLQAIDRGGELITFLWALLTHIGIIGRPEDAAAASAPSTGV